MPTVTGYTAEYMEEINDNTVVDGNIVGDNLILVTRGGTNIDAGNVRGPQGIQGLTGEVSTVELNAAISALEAELTAAGAVSTAMIALGAIVTDRIADNAVTESKIAANAVTTTKIADSAVTAAKLATDSVTSSKIQNEAVSTLKLADNAVNSSKILDGAVGTVELAAGAVTAAKQSFVYVQAGQPPVVAGNVWIIP